jgi:hypothetical protein
MVDDGHMARRRARTDLSVLAIMAFLVTRSLSFILPEAPFG